MAKKPVLAVVPKDGAAAQIIKSTKTGIIADSDNIQEIKEAIYSYYKQWKHGGIIYEPDQDQLRKYDMNELTKKLAEVLDKCL